MKKKTTEVPRWVCTCDGWEEAKKKIKESDWNGNNELKYSRRLRWLFSSFYEGDKLGPLLPYDTPDEVVDFMRSLSPMEWRLFAEKCVEEREKQWLSTDEWRNIVENYKANT